MVKVLLSLNMRMGVQNKKRCFPSADIRYFSKAKRRKNDAL